MYIKKVMLNNFRNYEEQEIKINKDINIIYGDNAQGKTNIIESIFLCAYGKSFRGKKDKDLIMFDKETAKVSIEYEKKDRDGKIEVEINDKKTFYINNIKQNKISDIIGKINVIVFTPEDIETIKEGPQKRRKFLDMMISSLKPNYIYTLNSYNRAVEQRNNYLRQIKKENKKEELLEILDEQLADLSFKVFEYREQYISKISNKIKGNHNLIAKGEEIEIKYISNGKNKESFLENLKKTRRIDIERGFTATGIHRDDFIIYINGKQVAIFGSQGQQRTAMLTLKLCELDIVKEEIEDSPILLLDDFMSELDSNRRKDFLDNIRENQVIITCTDKMKIGKNVKTYYIEKRNL